MTSEENRTVPVSILNMCERDYVDNGTLSVAPGTRTNGRGAYLRPARSPIEQKYNDLCSKENIFKCAMCSDGTVRPDCGMGPNITQQGLF